MKNLNLKYKKYHKRKMYLGYNYWKSYYNMGFFNVFIISKKTCFLSSNEIEATRKMLRRSLNKKYKININKLLNVHIYKQSKGARMGKGVGSLKGFCIYIKKGNVLFNIEDINLINSISVYKKKIIRLSGNYRIVNKKKKEIYKSRGFNVIT